MNILLLPKRKNFSWFSLVLIEYNTSYLGYFAIMATLSLYAVRGLHLSALPAGALLLFISLCFRFSRTLLAPLIDGLPVRRAAFLALLMASLGYLGLAFTQTLAFVLPLFLLIGLGHGINSMLVKTVTAYSPGMKETQRPAFLRYTYLAAGVNIMTALGSMLGSTLLLRVSFNSVFLLAAFLYACSALVAAFLPTFSTHTAQRPRWRTVLQLTMKRPALRRAMLSTFLGWFLYTQYYASLPLFVTNGLQRPDLLFTLFGLNALLLIAQVPLSNLLIRFRVPLSQVIFLALLSFACGYVLLWLFPTWPVLYGAVVLWTLGEMLLIPTLDTQVAEGAAAEQRHIAFLLNSMVIGLGEGLGNLAGVGLVSWLLRFGDVRVFYLLLFAFTLLAIGLTTLTTAPRESFLLRRLRGLPWLSTGETGMLTAPLAFLPETGRVHTLLRWLGASSFQTEVPFDAETTIMLQNNELL